MKTNIVASKVSFSLEFITQSNSSDDEAVWGELATYQRKTKRMVMFCNYEIGMVRPYFQQAVETASYFRLNVCKTKKKAVLTVVLANTSIIKK